MRSYYITSPVTTMLNATLGGLIKDYRIKKRLLQSDLSRRIGWRDTSRLSKIEQGRVGRPTRITIDKIINALGLSEQEKGEFLLVGGYLPSASEIKKITKTVEERIMTWQYPAFLIDFSWRCLLINYPTAKVFCFPKDLVLKIPELKPNLLEFVIAPKEIMPVSLYKGDDRASMKPFIIAQIAQFKIEHMGRENDSWYKALISKLAKNDVFLKYWNEVTIQDYHKKLLDYEYKEVELSGKKTKKNKFHVFTSRLILDQRFQVILYLPADKV